MVHFYVVKQVFIKLIFGLIFLFFFQCPVLAAPIYDLTAGTWADSFADSTGILSTSGAGVSGGSLSLKNSGGGYTSPFLTEGYVSTVNIGNTSGLVISRWGQINLSATLPEGTSYKVQVLDGGGTVFSNTYLPGNETGFSGSSIDISALPIDANMSNNTKVPMIRLKITLYTTNTAVSPTIDSVLLTWTLNSGDVSGSPLADTAWPALRGGPTNSGFARLSDGTMYPALRWINSYPNLKNASIVRGNSDYLFAEIGNNNNYAKKLLAINSNTGNIDWQRVISTYQGSLANLSLSNNGSLFSLDIVDDVISSYDTSDGSIKWTKNLVNGHWLGSSNFDSLGNYYYVNNDTGVVYGLGPNGSQNWSRTLGGTISIPPFINSDDKIIVVAGNYAVPSSIKIYALNRVDGSTFWEYSPGYAVYGAVMDGSGNIYFGDDNFSHGPTVTSIDKAGVLRWSETFDSLADDVAINLFASDDRLVFFTYTTCTAGVVNSVTGELLWTNEFLADYCADISGSKESVIKSTGDFLVVTNSYTNAKIYYYNHDFQYKWSYGSSIDLSIFGLLSLDENDRIYTSYSDYDLGTGTKTLAFFPWEIVTNNLNGTYHQSGDTIPISVVSSMPATNLLTTEANQMQVVMGDDTKVALTYLSTNSDGDSVWTGSYTVPSDRADGLLTYTIEANQAQVETDITVHFASPATYSNNTGIISTGSLTIDNTGPTLSTTSPNGYESSNQFPVLEFAKASDSGSEVSSYDIYLDEGYSSNYSITGIPDDYVGVWVDNSQYRVEVTDRVGKVTFKDLNSNPLREGSHTWKVVAIDSLGNQTEKVTSFKVDKTAPSINDLAIADYYRVDKDGVYKIGDIYSVLSFSGEAIDLYQGYQSGSIIYSKASSGPKKIQVVINKLNEESEYLSQDYYISDIVDDEANSKSNRFFLTLATPLTEGYYTVKFLLDDNAGNQFSFGDFFIDVNPTYPISNFRSFKTETKKLSTEIIDESVVPRDAEESTSNPGYIVKIFVVDDKKQPVNKAKVTMHSKVQVAYTDENGIAVFSNVEPGDHRVLIAYDNFEGEQAINLSGEIKEFSYTIQVREPNYYIYIYGGLILLGIILLRLLFKKVGRRG